MIEGDVATTHRSRGADWSQLEAGMRCRLCDSERMSSVLDLGATPACESFLTKAELDQPELTYPLHLRLCEDCLLLQIPALITPQETFTEYAYFSSYSDSWVQHARRFVHLATGRLGLGHESLVVEVASNDGYLLQHVTEAGIPCVGVEPSVNIGAVARDRGIPTETAFLDEGVADSIREQYGPADLVVANNVYAHIPDVLGFTRSLRRLMADDGWLTIEVHHALNLIRLGQFDTIYHEHFQYYTLTSAIRALATAGLEVRDVELLPTHGGSIRLWVQAATAPGVPSQRVADLLRTEESAGLHRLEGYLTLRTRTEKARHDLLRYLLDRRAEGRRVVGYGAPGKGNTLLNYCGIRSDLLEYTVDRSPYKQGRFLPGSRIPIYEPGKIDIDKPDIVLGLPWNLEAELTGQLEHIGQWGGQLVFPLPTLHTARI
jgi:hypothetical protein